MLRFNFEALEDKQVLSKVLILQEQDADQGVASKAPRRKDGFAVTLPCTALRVSTSRKLCLGTAPFSAPSRSSDLNRSKVAMLPAALNCKKIAWLL